jgi:hypothetical protein
MLKYFSTLLISMLLVISVAGADSVMTWSAYDGKQQGMNVYLRQESANGSAVERQMTHGGVNILPTLQMDGSIIWLAWVDQTDADRYVLKYAVVLAGTLTLIETGAVATQDARIYSPAITVSPQGTPWLAWAGFDGQDEEIRIAYYENGRWTPERAVTNNEIPDSVPRFEIQADGILQLNWEQTTSTAIISKHTNILPIAGYSLSRASPSEVIIEYKKRMGQKRQINPDKPLPAALEKRKKDILMGYLVELGE